MRAISPPWATLGQWQMEILANDDFEKTFFKNTQMIPFSFYRYDLHDIVAVFSLWHMGCDATWLDGCTGYHTDHHPGHHHDFIVIMIMIIKNIIINHYDEFK